MDSVDALSSQIAKNGFGLTVIKGTSMRPLIWGGRHCVAVAPLVEAPVVGDLLAFVQKRDGREIGIVHRLVEIKDCGDRCLYITRGDNCLGSETVRPDEVIGRVVEVHRIGAYRPWYVIGAKKFAVTDAAYLRYTRLWSTIWPARRIVYRLGIRVGTVRRRLMSIFRKDR